MKNIRTQELIRKGSRIEWMKFMIMDEEKDVKETAMISGIKGEANYFVWEKVIVIL
jgi:hypothetical protein